MEPTLSSTLLSLDKEIEVLRKWQDDLHVFQYPETLSEIVEEAIQTRLDEREIEIYHSSSRT